MRKFLFFLILLISVLLLPTEVLAVDFKIENTQINAYLQENGDVLVEEQHTYQFDGKFNGITRTLIPKENTSIEHLEAYENNEPLKVDQEEALYKIYRGGSDETITIDISYRINNGVDVYLDLAEFYWPFFDSSNESTYQNMDIYIHPPQPTEGVIAFGYDQAQESFRSETDGMVHFALGEVEEGTNGDIRVAYDSSIFPSATLTAETNIHEKVLADKTELEEQIAAFKNRKEILGQVAPFAVAAVTLYFLLLMVSAWRKKKLILWEVDRSSFQSSLPKEEMSLPATILYMNSYSGNGPLLSASLMNLVRKGYVSRKNDNDFVVVNRNADHKHERMLIDWLFYKIGDDGSFSLDDLDRYTKKTKNQSAYQDELHQWTGAVKEETKQHKLYEKKRGLRWTVGITSILLIPFMILFAVHELYMWMFFMILLCIGLLLFAIIYHPRTVQGARIKQQWDQFSAHYPDINEKDWSEWMSEEQMKAFIYAIGTNNKQMKKKNETLAKGLSNTAVDYTSNDMIMLMLIASTLSHRFNQADQTVSAATGGGSGYSGGGAGVGGGGGGSGAF